MCSGKSVPDCAASSEPHGSRILPTTTVIHVVRFGSPRLVLHWQDGQQEERLLTPEVLRDFSSDEAGGTIDPESVEYAEIFLELPLLKRGLVIVDTPGTNDLNQMRSEIVCRMIPRADAVLFVLDATTQLSRTEKTFLTDRLIQSFAPPLCFVLNKLDRVDDSDAVDDVLEATARTLRDHLPMVDLKLVGASTRDPAIGTNQVQAFLNEFLDGGTRFESRSRRYEILILEMKRIILSEIDERIRLATLAGEELGGELTKAEEEGRSLSRRLADFATYARQNGSETLIPMVQRSFEFNLSELNRQITATIRNHSNPAAFANNDLPLILERNFKQWMEVKLPEIGHFTNRYQRAMLLEFQAHFDPAIARKLHLQGMAPSGSHRTWRADEMTITKQAIETGNNDLIRFGLPAAGMLLGALMSGGLAIAFGGAIGGFLGQKLQKEKLEGAQAVLEAELPSLLHAQGGKFMTSITSEIMAFMESFLSQLDEAGRNLHEEHRQRLQQAMNDFQRNQEARKAFTTEMEALRNQIEEM